ncbi:MAG: septum formation initiator family protein [Firmicutes bacterium]|nr:septum formation initiator family protein [Bacillota bacterium]
MAERKGELAQIQARKRKLNIWKLLMLLALIIVVVYFVLSAVKILDLNKQKAELEAENKKLKETVEDLKLQQETIDSDQYMEDLARRQLRLIKGNEILFILPEIRAASEGEETIFKGSTEKAVEEAEANRKIQEAEAAQADNADGEGTEDEAAEGSGEASGDGSAEGGSGDSNG